MEIVRKIFVFLQRSIWYLPLVSALLFWVYVLLMTNAIGHLPRYDMDVITITDLIWFCKMLNPVLAIGFFSGLFCLLYLLLKIFFRKMPLYTYDVVFLLAGIALFILNFQTDEMEWLLD